MKSSLDKHNNGVRELHYTADALRTLAGAASMLGLEVLANDLHGLAKDMDTEINQVDEAYQELLDEALRQTRESTQNMFNAALNLSGITPNPNPLPD